MSAMECDREIEIVEAVTCGRWPAGVDEELQLHAATCAVRRMVDGKASVASHATACGERAVVRKTACESYPAGRGNLSSGEADGLIGGVIRSPAVRRSQFHRHTRSNEVRRNSKGNRVPEAVTALGKIDRAKNGRPVGFEPDL